MDPKQWFDEPSPESKTKIDIVTEYFDAWSNVLAAKSPQLAYVDLFSGPGRYVDGTESVPLCILKKTIEKKLQSKVVAIFNDRDFCDELRNNVYTIPEISTFSIKPDFKSVELSNDIIATSRIYASVRSIPTLFFIDPWGFKGLSLSLALSTIRGFGCDCIFFFNYSRINRDLDADIFRKGMDDLFGPERSESLRISLQGLSPEAREMRIIDEIIKGLESGGAKYIHYFRFCFPDQPGRTSHYLFHITKHPKGHGIIKRITAKYSTSRVQGFAGFQFDRNESKQGELFHFPADDLRESLLEVFDGQKLPVAAILAIHPTRSRLRCTDTNYRKVLYDMEIDGAIATDRPFNTRAKGTMGDSVVVSFPKKRRSK